MARSKAQKALRKRQIELRKHFLPNKFSKIGAYSDGQRHLAGAYRIFFFAELENYFEVIARSVLNHCEAEWKKGITTRAFAAICSRNSKNVNMPQESSHITARNASESYLNRRFVEEVGVIRRTINSNNGAKSHNILTMFVPLGINEFEIDNSLMAECDTLGSDRGFLAHNTAGAAAYLIDPRTEYDRSRTIIGLLDAFEALVEL